MKLIIAVLLGILLIGCDTYRTYDYHILNSSDSTIILLYKLGRDYGQDTIPPHSDFLICTLPTNNGKVDLQDKIITRYFDTMIIKYNNNVELKKDIYKRENWEYNIKDKEKNIYTLKIRNND